MEPKTFITLPTVLVYRYDNTSVECQDCLKEAEELGLNKENHCEDCIEEGLQEEAIEVNLKEDITNIRNFCKSESDEDRTNVRLFTGELVDVNIDEQTLAQKLKDAGITIID